MSARTALRAALVFLAVGWAMPAMRPAAWARGPGAKGNLTVSRETPIAKLADIDAIGKMQMPGLIIAPDYAKAGYVTYRERRSVAVINGVEGKPYDGVQTLIFSPTGGRACFIARQGGNWCLVADGKEGKWYAGDVTYSPPPVFSADGKRLAYVAHPQVSGGKAIAVVDGAESPQYDGIIALRFSPDGGRAVFLAQTAAGHQVVVDGKPGKAYSLVNPSEGAFSPDGKRLAYAARKGQDKWVVVLDGVEGREYDQVLHLAFSPDGKRLAYEARRRANWCIVVDGKEGDEYSRLWGKGPAFSPDGKRLAFVAEGGNFQHAVIIDGTARKELSNVMELAWSSDSRRLLCKVLNDPWWVLEDGQADRQYPGDGLAISPNLKRIAHAAQRRQDWVVAADGTDGPRFQGIGPYPIIFSPEGKHIAYIAKRGSKKLGFQWHLVVDGAVSQAYDDSLPRGGRIVFDGENRIRTLMVRQGQIVLVEAQLGE